MSCQHLPIRSVENSISFSVCFGMFLSNIPQTPDHISDGVGVEFFPATHFAGDSTKAHLLFRLILQIFMRQKEACFNFLWSIRKIFSMRLCLHLAPYVWELCWCFIAFIHSYYGCHMFDVIATKKSAQDSLVFLKTAKTMLVVTTLVTDCAFHIVPRKGFPLMSFWTPRWTPITKFPLAPCAPTQILCFRAELH